MNSNLQRWLEYLSFLHLGLNTTEIYAPAFCASKSGAQLPYCNRVLFRPSATEATIATIQQFYGNVPYTLWIQDTEPHSEQLLRAHGFTQTVSFPLMHRQRDLQYFFTPAESITVKRLTEQKDIYDTWIPLLNTIYGTPHKTFDVFIVYVLSSPMADRIHFYVGYYDGVAAAISMVIQHTDTAELHWVGTLPDYRNRGLGDAVSQTALQELPASVTDFLLYASPLGKQVYEKMGFKTIEIIDVFKKV